MNNERFFELNQQLILQIANSEAGKLLFSKNNRLDLEIGNDPIIAITPDGIHVLRDIKGDKLVIQAYFGNAFGGQAMAQLFRPRLQEADEAIKYLIEKRRYEEGMFKKAFEHYAGLKRDARMPAILFTTDTFTGAITNFGMLSTSSNNWATIRAGNNLSVGTWSNIATTGFGCLWDGANYSIRRFFFHFNSASIPDIADITAGFLRVVGTTTSDQNADGDSERLVSSLVSADTSLLTSDWGNVGSTDFGTIAFSGWNSSGNNDITLVSAGLSAISKTGYTKFAARSLRDVNNTAPTGHNNETFSPTTTNHILSVTYTASSIKKLGGIDYANLKKVGGIAIANVKKIGGIQ